MVKVPGRRNVTIAMLVAIFLIAMDNTVVSTAMPTIIKDLGGVSLLSWVYAAYLLTTAVTTPVFGKLSDLYGRKIIFIIGVILFVIGSMLSGTSHTMGQLIWYRAFQGIGAGAVLPVTFTIIGDLYPGEERGKMQGLFSSIWGIAGLVGPLAGGFIVDNISWQWIFYINVPVGIVSVILVWTFLHEHFEKKRHRVDIWGALTFLIGTTSLLYALLSGGQKYTWGSTTIISLFIVAVASLTLFLWIETKASEPMLPLSLFKIPSIAVANFAGFFVSAVLIAVSVYLPMWIQGIEGHSATNSGLTLVPMSIAWPIGSVIGGRLMYKIGIKTVSIVGMVCIVIGSLWLATVQLSSSQAIFVGVMVLVGFGMGFSITSFTVLVQNAVGWNLRGTATASNTLLRSLGQTVGVAVYGTWFNQTIHAYEVSHAHRHLSSVNMSQFLTSTNTKGIPEAVLQSVHEMLATALHHVFVAVAITAVVSLLVTLCLPSAKSVRKETKAPQVFPQPDLP